MFVTFYLCVLLGPKVAAQLDLGTYKIVNIAALSSLCADNASGEPNYYVTAHGNPCPHELWVLGAGDEHDSGVYTVKNLDLGSNVGVDGASGSVVANNSVTSFAVKSVPGGNSYYIIKLPNSNLVWTVGPTISHSNILLQSTKKIYNSQLWTFIPTDSNDTIVGHDNFTVQARSPQELGGHNITAARLFNGTLTVSDFDHITWTYSYPVEVDITSYLIYTTIDITTEIGLTASGHAWGLGIAHFQLTGVLSYNSEDTLVAAETNFAVVAAGEVAAAGGIAFTVNDQIVAWMVLGGSGSGFDASYGSVTWSQG
jgi:hypothetical protein